MIVAQLSDIHAGASDGALDRLDKVLGWLEPLRPDAILVSGDLAEVGHRQNYAEVRNRLEDTRAPFYVVPGNVDDHREMRAAFGKRFGWPDEGHLSCAGQVGPDLRVIGLDVTVAGAHHGDAVPVLEWLVAELNTGGARVMIFQHQHPFLCGIGGKDRNICHGGEELAQVINEARDPVVALTCGHVHRPMFTRFAGRPATMCPSVARANRLKLDGKEPEISDPPGLLVHHFDDDRLVSHVVMVA